MNVVRVKVLSALASFIAGLGGSLLAYRRGVVTFDSFTAIGGLALLSTAYLAGITSVWGGINAGILAASGITFIALDRWVNLGEWFQVISGVLLIVTLITNPEVAAGHEIADRWARWKASRRAGEVVAERPTVAPVPPPAVVAADGNGSALAVDHLTVRYGGVVAGATCRPGRAGQIVGLIGPSGAGKTSVIDGMVTGFAPAAGRSSWPGGA